LLNALRRLRNVSSVVAGLKEEVSDPETGKLRHDWQIWARDDQLAPPVGDPPWRTWILMGGRGAGKTRAGAEWVRAEAIHALERGGAPARIALIGETLNDVRSIMVEGVSGLIAVHRDDERPTFEPSNRRLVWPNGSIAQMFSAEEPDGLRGPQFTAAWADEICKWRHAEATWDMLQFGLRLGDEPRQVVTTTPRPTALMKRLLADPGTILTRARTVDNQFLAPGFVRAIKERYAGSLLGRQELDGELIEERSDALFNRAVIDAARVREPPAMSRIVVAVDPPVTSGRHADACGIVAAGLGEDGRGYVLADRSLRGIEPLEWGRAAVAAYHDLEADRLVAETNQGGELVTTLIREIDADVPVRKVYASRGKFTRAEPVAALYAQGRISHVGTLPELEDEMCDFGAGGLSGGRSPDRMDALVWALTDLMLTKTGRPRVRAA
jgi:phage terminase large subunit-like protein